MSSEDYTDYDVGYRKPPIHSRFKKGKLGNPTGKRAQESSINELIRAELNKTIQITENGKTKRVTKRQAIAKKFVHKAMQGDHRALKQVMEARLDAEQSPFPGDGPFHFTLKLEEDDRGVGGPMT